MADLGVKVYYSKIPVGEIDFTPKSRERAVDISAVKNDRLRKEKAYAWRLLEYAIANRGINVDELDFEKNENGKWVCDKCYFSLSHTHGAVAVAVSDFSVGVDIEKVSVRANNVAKKVFSSGELEGCDGDEILYTTRLWTKKESIFKTLDLRVFSPQSIVISEHETKTLELDFDGEKYVVSVAGVGAENAEFYEK